MPIVTLRPTGPGANGIGNWTVEGTASFATAVSDDSDATYLRHAGVQGAQCRWAVPAPTLPAGAKIFAVRARMRHVKESASGDSVALNVSAPRASAGEFTATTTITTVATAWTTRPVTGEDEWTPELVAGDGFHSRAVFPNSPASRVHELYVDVDYNERPVVANVGPTAAVTDTTRPTITADYSDPEGDALQAAQVQVLDGSTLLYDSGEFAASGLSISHQVGQDLPAQATLTVRVRARQAWAGHGQHWSEWTSGTLTMDVPGPAAPLVAVTSEPGQARTRIDCEDPPPADPQNPPPTAAFFRVEYRDGPGPWTDVRGAKIGELPADLDGKATVYDWEAPFGRERQYRVRGYAETTMAASAPTLAAGTLAAAGRWITDPLDPEATNLRVRVHGHTRSIEGRETVHLPAGMTVAVVESEPPIRSDGIEMRTREPAAHDALTAVLRSSRTLLFRDRRDALFFRWVRSRTVRQLGPDVSEHDVMSGSMIEVARPPS